MSINTEELTEEQIYRLKLLDGLYQRGAITEDEYNNEQLKILGHSKRRTKKEVISSQPVSEKTVIKTEAPKLNKIPDVVENKADKTVENKPGCVSGCFSLILWGFILLAIINLFMR